MLFYYITRLQKYIQKILWYIIICVKILKLSDFNLVIFFMKSKERENVSISFFAFVSIKLSMSFGWSEGGFCE